MLLHNISYAHEVLGTFALERREYSDAGVGIGMLVGPSGGLRDINRVINSQYLK